MAALGLDDMNTHFLPRRKSWVWDRRTWSMYRGGREVKSWADYILGSDRHQSHNVSIKDPRNNTDHYMILGCLHSAKIREHTQYLERRKRYPLLPHGTPTREDLLISDL